MISIKEYTSSIFKETLTKLFGISVACSLHSSLSGNINCKEGCARDRDEVVIVPADVGRVRIFINIYITAVSKHFI
jgi:hypothetical protein